MKQASLLLTMWFSVVISAPVAAQSKVILGDHQSAYECFRRAESAITSHFADRHDIAKCDQALEDLHLTRRHRSATLVNRGILLVASGNIVEARASYDQALELVDDQGEVYVNIANVYMMQKNYQRAVDEYTRGIPAMKRRLHVAYLNRGLAHEYMKDFPQAERDYQQALELAPEWMRAKKMLARVQLKQQDMDRH